jgi:hypothetical protein
VEEGKTHRRSTSEPSCVSRHDSGEGVVISDDTGGQARNLNNASTTIQITPDPESVPSQDGEKKDGQVHGHGSGNSGVVPDGTGAQSTNPNTCITVQTISDPTNITSEGGNAKHERVQLCNWSNDPLDRDPWYPLVVLGKPANLGKQTPTQNSNDAEECKVEVKDQSGSERAR